VSFVVRRSSLCRCVVRRCVVVSLCRCVVVSLCRCVVVSLCRCVVVSLCRCVVVSLCRSSSFVLHRHRHRHRRATVVVVFQHGSGCCCRCCCRSVAIAFMIAVDCARSTSSLLFPSLPGCVGNVGCDIFLLCCRGCVLHIVSRPTKMLTEIRL